jgi:methylenetetrahydrofolate dehydrogenase (NADP+)/methenyltetrahydrofolate cyclohydrolase
MVQKIDGRAIAERVKDKITQEIFALKGARPNLAIILVGERPDSQLYVSLKEREGKKVGIDTHLYEISAEAEEAEILSCLKFLNDDGNIDGILVQLPLPEKFNTDKIIAAIKPEKDVDGFRADHPDYILSPVLSSVLACLDETKVVTAGKKACVLYNSEIFGNGVKEILTTRGLIIVAPDHSAEADVLVTALGEPQKIKKEQIKAGATVIDIGITQVGDRVWGDVDYEDVKTKAGFITPVPGGIGPMTIAFLFRNVWDIYQRRSK